jgi:hypothetical protein
VVNSDLPRSPSAEDDFRAAGTADVAPEPAPDTSDDDVVAHWVQDGDDPPWCIGAVSMR